eukprot:1330558-Amorphochlora_amoeboformis.AAC.1
MIKLGQSRNVVGGTLEIPESAERDRLIYHYPVLPGRNEYSNEVIGRVISSFGTFREDLRVFDSSCTCRIFCAR